MPAKFYELEIKSGLKDKRKLSTFLDALVAKHKRGNKKTNLTYIFCTDEYLLQKNQQFLNHDTLTDIITFDLSENEQELAGEIYISIERITDNAAKYKVPATHELHRVIFHGALHLCGFKDKKPADKQLMRQKEDECLTAYNKELDK